MSTDKIAWEEAIEQLEARGLTPKETLHAVSFYSTVPDIVATLARYKEEDEG